MVFALIFWGFFGLGCNVEKLEEKDTLQTNVLKRLSKGNAYKLQCPPEQKEAPELFSHKNASYLRGFSIIQPETFQLREMEHEGIKIRRWDLSRENQNRLDQTYFKLSPKLYQMEAYPRFKFVLFETHDPLREIIYIEPVLISPSDSKSLGIRFFRDQKDVLLSVPLAWVTGLRSGIRIPGNPLDPEDSVFVLPQGLRDLNLREIRHAFGRDQILPLQLAFSELKLFFQGERYPAVEIEDFSLDEVFYARFRMPYQVAEDLVPSITLRPDCAQVIAQTYAHLKALEKHLELEVPFQTIQSVFQSIWSDFQGKPFFLFDGFFEDGIKRFLNANHLLYEVSNFSAFKHRAKEVIFGKRPFSTGKEEDHGESFKMELQERIRLSSDYRSVTSFPLSSVSVQSSLQLNPSIERWLDAEKPKSFELLTKDSLFTRCEDLTGLDAWESAYCQNLSLSQSLEEDYQALGTNVSVSPGSWLRFDFDEAFEFTRAMTQTNTSGQEVIAPQMIDVLALRGIDPMVCVQTEKSVCEEYESELIAIRDHAGHQLKEDERARLLESDAAKVSDNVVEVHQGFLFRRRIAFECDAKDLIKSCPWTHEETVFDTEIQYECHDGTGEVKFLWFFEVSSSTRRECYETARVPVARKKLVPLCPASLDFHTECRRPKHKCKRFNTACLSYQQMIHREVVHERDVAKWRKMSLEDEDIARRIPEGLWLKFVSPQGVSRDCQVSRFQTRSLSPTSFMIRIPQKDEPENLVCGYQGEEPLWKEGMDRNDQLPKLYIKNSIRLPRQQTCGITEEIVRPLPVSPGERRLKDERSVVVRTIPGTCSRKHVEARGANFVFQEVAPIRLQGRVSVLGQTL